jgi:hypothetical protein
MYAKTHTHTYIYIVSPYLTGDTPIYCGPSVPYRRRIDTLWAVRITQETHQYTVGSPYLTKDTDTMCVDSLYLTGDTPIHCGQSVPHRRHGYTVRSLYLTEDTPIHCGDILQSFLYSFCLLWLGQFPLYLFQRLVFPLSAAVPQHRR